MFNKYNRVAKRHSKSKEKKGGFYLRENFNF